MILPMHIFGQRVLRQRAEDVPSDYPALGQLVGDMFETLAQAEGVGLAAPQVGLPLRVVVIDLDCLCDETPQFKGFRRTFINGRVVEEGSETCSMEEGCLSIPGVHERVARPSRVRISYLDEQLRPHDEWVDGYLARVVQHEFDHLEGRLFVDRLTPLRKQLVRKKLKAMAEGKFNCAYKAKPNRK